MLPQSSQFKTDAPPKPSDPNDNADPRNNPLSPKFTGTKTPIPGKKGWFTVLNKGEKPPTPDTRTPDQKRSADLDSGYALRKKYYKPPADGGWTARGLHDLDTKIGTLNGLMDKVGPKSPRYAEFLGAKARYQAGGEKIMTPVAEPPKGIHPSTNKHWYAWQQGPGQSTADYYTAQTKTSPQMAEDYDIKTNTYTDEKLEGTKEAADYNADRLKDRKDILNSGSNASYYANKKRK